MPFAVFRRHQKKLIAIFAILAMGGFVLSDSLPSLLRGGSMPDASKEVVKLAGKSVPRSELNRLAFERSRANRFMALLLRSFGVPMQDRLFGGTSDAELVDALICEREAQRLGMPANAEFAAQWLRDLTPLKSNPAVFDRVYQESFADQLTETDLLAELANQIRIRRVESLPIPERISLLEVTPLDVYQAFRDQNERASFFAVPFAVEEEIATVPDPSTAEISEFYERYKNALPDPDRETPGFMTPRRVRVEAAWIDEVALAETIRTGLTDADLRADYDARKSEFLSPPPELPQGLFANEPGLTPKTNDPFYEVRDEVARTIARERARERVDEHFETIKRDAIAPFSDRYDDVIEANEEAKLSNGPQQALPEPGDVIRPLAEKLGLKYERTPLVTQRELADRRPLGRAAQGTSSFGESRSIGELLFQPRSALYDVYELADPDGTRFITWKLDDLPAEVPPLDQIRDRVVYAWKFDKARRIAERAAESFAEELRKAGGGDKAKELAGKRRLIQTEPTAKLQPNPLAMLQQMPAPALLSELPDFPQAGAELRDSLFSLEPKAVAVTSDLPKAVYYVVTLASREKAPFDQLYGVVGSQLTLRTELSNQEAQERYLSWRKHLRDQAGLPADWKPADASAPAGE
jgi:peptidyl-prolyl cis-trans isomerase D